MPDDTLSLSGVGGLYNGEVFVLKRGQSATVGASTLSSFPVSLCRNYRRLTGRVPLDSLLASLAPEHVRFLYVGDDRLIVENLAGRDVRVGGAPLDDRRELDLGEGRVEVAFGFGERLVAASPGSPDEMIRLAADTPDRDDVSGVFVALLAQDRIREMGMAELSDDAAADSRTPTGDLPELVLAEESGDDAEPADGPPAGGEPAEEGGEPPPAPAGEPVRKRKRRGAFGFFGRTPAWLLSVLFHAVVMLGLFAYVRARMAAEEDARTALVAVRAPAPPSPRAAPPPASEVPTEMPESATEVPEVSPTVAEAEHAAPGGDPAADSGEDGPPGDTGVGSAGVIGVGPGGLGDVPGGPSRGRPGARPGGGATIREPAVARGLAWLREHQLEDGGWDGITSVARCEKCTGIAARPYRAALTGLSVLAFVGAGHTHRRGRHRESVKSAARYLIGLQTERGGFHPPGSPREDREMYGTAIATFALAELLARSDSPFLRGPVTRGVRFIERAQAPYGAWRYQPGERESDTSVTGWQVLALVSAQRAGIEVNPATFFGASVWLDRMTEPETYRVGYNRRGRGSLGMTATGAALRLLMGGRQGDPELKAADRLLRDNPPTWPVGAAPARGNPPDLNYWYFGTLAAQRFGGDTWRTWNDALPTAIRGRQARAGHEKGSWPAPGRWGRVGGRVFNTALAVILLELSEGSRTVFK